MKIAKLFWCFGWWGWRFVQVDVAGNCYAYAKVRPRWFWFLRRLQLFGIIVFRKYERERIRPLTAWQVSKCAKGLSR